MGHYFLDTQLYIVFFHIYAYIPEWVFVTPLGSEMVKKWAKQMLQLTVIKTFDLCFVVHSIKRCLLDSFDKNAAAGLFYIIKSNHSLSSTAVAEKF